MQKNNSVVSQFRENKLSMFFVQNGKKIEVPAPQIEGVPGDTSDITPEFCTSQFQAFGDRDRFAEVGGFSQLNAALRIPMVLVMSIWDDHYSNMLWLDSIYPPEKEGQPGAARGPCAQDSGVPSEVEAQYGNSYAPPFPAPTDMNICGTNPSSTAASSGPTSASDLSDPQSTYKRGTFRRATDKKISLPLFSSFFSHSVRLVRRKAGKRVGRKKQVTWHGVTKQQLNIAQTPSL